MTVLVLKNFYVRENLYGTLKEREKKKINTIVHYSISEVVGNDFNHTVQHESVN